MKKIYVFIIIVLIVVLLNNYSHANLPKALPPESAFTLEITCEDNIILGNTANINVSFLNHDNDTYHITFKNSFFKLIVNGDAQAATDNTSTSIKLSQGEMKASTIAFCPEKLGINKIEVIVAFEIELSQGKSKEYLYKKSVEINVVENLAKSNVLIKCTS